MMRTRSPGRTEVGTIIRPTKYPADAGREGQPEIICDGWLFGFAKTGGREMNVALQMTPLATSVLIGWDCGKPVSAKDYVEWNGKRLNVEFVDDKHPPELILTCIEQAT